MKVQEYEIKVLRDILAIPMDRMPAFFADLATWVQLAHKSIELEQLFKSAFGQDGVSFSTEGFTWRDDGIEGMSAIGFVGEAGESLGTLELNQSQQEGE